MRTIVPNTTAGSGLLAALAPDVTVLDAQVEPEGATLVAYAAKHGLANLCRLILNSNEFVFVN